MRANERALLAACIDTGIYAGWIRAHKHDDAPPELLIQEDIDNAIWYEIDQYFVFDSERDLCDEVVEGFDELEEMRRKCIVKDCENHTDQGGFTGDLCNPCYDFISKGKGVYSQAYRNAQREWVGLTDEDIEEVFTFPWHCMPFARAIEAKLKEKNNG